MALLLGGGMFFISRDKKIAIMFIGCMTLTLLKPELPLFKECTRFFIYMFFLSEIPYIYAILKEWLHSPLKNIFSFLLAAVLLAALFSPHINSLDSLVSFLKSELLFKYFAIGYSFVSFRNEQNLKTLVRYSIFPMIILTMFGVINLVEHRSFFVSEMMSNWSSNSINDVNEMAGDKFTNLDRFRVQAMFFNPFDYGYICSLCLMLYIYAFNCKMINKNLLMSLVFCCLFGILFCGCRTVMFCSISAVSVYFLLAFKTKKFVMYGLFSVLLFVTSYLFVPIVNEKIDEMTTMFTDTRGRNYNGSSIEARSIQFAATLSYIQDSPMFGRGVNFFNVDLGWSGGKEMALDSRLLGLEGVYLHYLLERGFVGYILYLLVWLSIVTFLIQKKKHNKKLSSLGISIWVTYVLFANMTGELLSVYPTLLLLGCIIGVLTYSNKRQEVLKKNQGFQL